MHGRVDGNIVNKAQAFVKVATHHGRVKGDVVKIHIFGKGDESFHRLARETTPAIFLIAQHVGNTRETLCGAARVVGDNMRLQKAYRGDFTIDFDQITMDVLPQARLIKRVNIASDFIQARCWRGCAKGGIEVNPPLNKFV